MNYIPFSLLKAVHRTWLHTKPLQPCLTLQSLGLQPTRFLCPWDFPGKNTGVGCHFILQGIFPTQGLNPCLLKAFCIERGFFTTEPPGKHIYIYIYIYIYTHTHTHRDIYMRVHIYSEVKSLIHVRPFATPWIVAHQAPRSMGYSRHEYWSGLLFPSPGDLPDPGIKPRSAAL